MHGIKLYKCCDKYTKTFVQIKSFHHEFAKNKPDKKDWLRDIFISLKHTHTHTEEPIQLILTMKLYGFAEISTTRTTNTNKGWVKNLNIKWATTHFLTPILHIHLVCTCSRFISVFTAVHRITTHSCEDLHNLHLYDLHIFMYFPILQAC